MELKRLLAIAGFLALASSAPAQTPPSTVNPLIPIAGQPVEQSGPALRQNFLAAMNDINALYARVNNGRTKLTSALTLYADFVNGSDPGNGCTSSGTPCKTIQKAYNQLVLNYDTAGQTATISFNNIDTQGLSVSTVWTGGGQVNIQGPGGTCTSQTIGIATAGSAVSVFTTLPAPINLVGFKISSSLGDAIVNFAAGTINANNLNFGATASVHMHAAATGAQVNWNGPYCISGGALVHYQATNGAGIAGAAPVTLTGTPAFTFFAESYALGLIYVPGVSFTGSAAGSRYFATLNGVIATNTGNPNFFPGNSAGSTSLGGQYQ